MMMIEMSGVELVREFVNTRERLDEVERLTDPEALVEWCRARGLVDVGARAGAADLRRAVELREALRRLLLRNNGVEIDAGAAFEVLDLTAKRARVGLRFDGGEARLVPAASGVPAALGRIVVGVHEAMADGSWARLKACRAPDCGWAFVDHARNQSRAWCSMRVCGNREKARAFRERRRGAAGAMSNR